MSESETEEVEADSVIQNMKDRRKASGQEIADIKLRQGLIMALNIHFAKLRKSIIQEILFQHKQSFCLHFH